MAVTRPDTAAEPTSHSVIFDISMHPVRKDQRHQGRFTH